MTKFTISLNTIAKVKDFSNVISKFDVDADITSVDSRYIIDAKSIMGIFSLDLSKNLTLVIHSEDAGLIEKIEAAITEFKA